MWRLITGRQVRMPDGASYEKHPEGQVTVSADENEDYKQRIAEITIAYGHQSFSINVKQFGLEPVIEVEGLTARWNENRRF